MQKSPVTQEQKKAMRMSLNDFKIEWAKVVKYFIERDAYRKNLRGWISKHGLSNLPKSVQDTVPTDMKVLYEIAWYLQPWVWVRMFMIAWHNAQNESIGRVTNA